MKEVELEQFSSGTASLKMKNKKLQLTCPMQLYPETVNIPWPPRGILRMQT